MVESTNEKEQSAEIEKGIFLPAIITVLAVVVLMIVFEAPAKKVIQEIFNFWGRQKKIVLITSKIFVEYSGNSGNYYKKLSYSKVLKENAKYIF